MRRHCLCAGSARKRARDGRPVLGMGEGGPRMDPNRWREELLEFDRRGRFHEMAPRWQSHAYGPHNPVALMIGTGGWAVYVATPWVEGAFSRSDASQGRRDERRIIGRWFQDN